MNASFASPEALGFLGFWSWNIGPNQIEATPRLRDLLCIPGDADDRGVAPRRSRIHPDDLAWLRKQLPRAIGPSGQGVIEYRVIDSAGQIRWVMCRGVYETDASGTVVHGHGMLIDITDFKMYGSTVFSAPAPLPHPLQALVDATLQAHAAAKQVGDTKTIKQLEIVLVLAAQLLADTITRDQPKRDIRKRVH